MTPHVIAAVHERPLWHQAEVNARPLLRPLMRVEAEMFAMGTRLPPGTSRSQSDTEKNFACLRNATVGSLL